jgi:hypothetical protein
MEMQMLAGVVRMMPKVIREHATDAVSAIPEYLEDVYQQTLSKLWRDQTLNTLKEVAVLDYFGLLDLIDKEYVVHGDQLLPLNSRNLAIAGYVDDSEFCTVRIGVMVKFIDICMDECELLSDAIIKALKLYICNINCRDGKITPFEYRIMKYLIKTHQ